MNNQANMEFEEVILKEVPNEKGELYLLASGSLGIENAQKFRLKVQEFIEAKPAGTPLVLDFTNVPFIDSSGVIALLQINEMANASGGKLRIIPSEEVAHVLVLLSMNRIMNIDIPPSTIS